MPKQKAASMVRLYESDVKAAKTLQETFGFTNLSSAVRYALHVTPKLENNHASH